MRGHRRREREKERVRKVRRIAMVERDEKEVENESTYFCREEAFKFC